MRVRLESGMAPSAARKAAGLPPRPKEKKPQFNERCATEGSSRAAAPPPPPIPVVPVPVIVEEIPEGRQRGKLVYLKEGAFFCVRDFSDLAFSTPSTRLHRAPDAQASSASSGRATPSPRTTTRFLI